MDGFLAKPEVMFETLRAMDMILVGTPDDVAERIAALRARGVTHVLCAAGAGGVPHEEALQSIELFAREVIPRFR
jgi:alkanesulfonate monooxygenase SsuD/methylene tetrahydromethanopterin reductase-like flavin-dependent oxidoreductase (luciferase family)